jgi:hypothetical protein
VWGRFPGCYSAHPRAYFSAIWSAGITLYDSGGLRTDCRYRGGGISKSSPYGYIFHYLFCSSGNFLLQRLVVRVLSFGSLGLIEDSVSYTILRIAQVARLQVTQTLIAMGANEGTGLVLVRPGCKRAPADVPSNATEDFHFSEVLQPSPIMLGIFDSHSTPIATQQSHAHGYHGHSSQALDYVKHFWSMRERSWKDGSTTIGDDIADLLQYYMYVS